MHQHMFRDILTMPFEKHWMMFWYIAIRKRNMRVTLGGSFNHCWRQDYIWNQKSAGFTKILWNIYDWLYQQREFLWMGIEWRPYRNGVEKSWLQMGGSISCVKYNSLLDFAIIIEDLCLSIPRKRNHWWGQLNRMTQLFGSPSNSLHLKQW